MRFALLLLVVAACTKPAASTATDPVYEWICRGRTTDREVTLRVMAANREDAIAAAMACASSSRFIARPPPAGTRH